LGLALLREFGTCFAAGVRDLLCCGILGLALLREFGKFFDLKYIKVLWKLMTSEGLFFVLGG